MVFDQYGKTPKRRKGPDLWFKSLRWMAVFGWLLLFAALLLSSKARPEIKTLIHSYDDLPYRISWNMKLARYVFYMMIVGFCASGVGLAINIRRKRRRDDEIYVSLVLVGIISLAGILFYLYSF